LQEIKAYDYILANLHSSSNHNPLGPDTLTVIDGEPTGWSGKK